MTQAADATFANARVRAPTRQKSVAFIQTQAENAGAQEVARQLAHGAARSGWRTRQIFFFRRTEAFDHEADAFFCARERPSSPLGVLKLLLELYKELRRDRPDAVVTFQHYGNVIAAASARLAGVRYVIANQLSAAETIPAPVRIADLWLGRLGAYDRIVVNSSSTQEAYAHYPRSYARRLLRIDHGFFDKTASIDRVEARRFHNLPEDAKLLGCAARLNNLKQIDLAILLLRNDPGLHLALAGQGPELARLQAFARDLGVGARVHFLGEQDEAGMGAFLAAIDCFVFPSAAETFGLAAVEAAQAGAPVVVNDLPSLREVLQVDGEPCALFVDATNALAFFEATRRALEDRALAARLAAVGRRLKQRFPLGAMIDAYLDLLERKSERTRCA